MRDAIADGVWQAGDEIAGENKENIDPDKAKKACELSMDKYCSVAATLREAHCKLTWEVTVNNVSSYTTK